MRGKGYVSGDVDLEWGITPAYAGKRYFFLQILSCQQDHPRLCGEKLPSGSTEKTVLGSPPPMRGKVKA